MNRRESLRALGLIAAGSGLLTAACNSKDAKNAAADNSKKLPGVQDFEYERTEQLYAEKFFDEHEMATITVLADIIIPKDNISGSASEAGVPDFIEFIVKDLPDNKIPMRGGLRWLDLQSKKRYGTVFIKCSAKDQLALVDDIAYPDLARPEMKQGAAFFSLMRNLTSSGFYTSEMGVKDIGYAGNKPGVWNGVPDDVLKEHGFDPTKFFG
ncbi:MULTISPECIES: gluconate 2-dehydrogenase subunit 3 family protein [Sphingobacterium]|jgi:gluconate 2-dehydrogenase gamma chain|uniref:Gluconate 2-dehydrogenase subunit 3 n=1 Tax=Sphingobacterium multivorum TaxID=28454 RepID=A0A2X2L7F6_SPHMU|nr:MULTISPECIES: gluconate 2-dehydrogenase subunit 3 family protein [Sphingobacterium]HAE67448.1 transcriptional initiation protein Tat [Sphingobacterium sp.]MDF2849327.1 transcriptional initiation protein Tat [Sphingobacterium multivorum]QQT44992.1 gluconate 2-dehydrogenase subunit 3 family protein [Sphingobacterium multivorum]QQT62349.1 gluconate 2-dehydrogenase subunit 3 family protein [Sphingobacterium multivorum]QRQ59520.1 gluconate 2-dehydrogenase subunit 3 family protein [Sphingobacteri